MSVPQGSKCCTACERTLEARFYYPRKPEDSGSTMRLCSKCMSCKADRVRERQDRNEQRLSQAAPEAACHKEQTCRRCNRLLPPAAYLVNFSYNTGISAVCRDCKYAQAARYVSATRLYHASPGIKRVPVPSEKQCGSCGKIKRIHDFGRNRGTMTGYSYSCRACNAARKAAIRKHRGPVIQQGEIYLARLRHLIANMGARAYSA